MGETLDDGLVDAQAVIHEDSGERWAKRTKQQGLKEASKEV
jgi:hypothetical protein